jgi:hypothetical protein
LAWHYGAQDIDAGENGPEVVGRPTDERKDAARRERQDTPVAVNDLLRNVSTKPNPVFNALFEPQELNGC